MESSQGTLHKLTRVGTPSFSTFLLGGCWIVPVLLIVHDCIIIIVKYCTVDLLLQSVNPRGAAVAPEVQGVLRRGLFGAVLTAGSGYSCSTLRSTA